MIKVRWILPVKARGTNEHTTIVITNYHRTVWLSVVPFFNSEAILGPDDVDEIVRTLGLAAQEARRYNT